MHSLQMSLNNPLPQPPAVAGGVQRLTPLSREAVMSQLDRIAAADAPPRAGQSGLGGKAGVMALVGGLVVVGMALMWRAPDEPARQPLAQVVPSAPVVQATPLERVPAAATVLPAPVVSAQPSAAPGPVAAAARPETQALAAAPVPSANDDAARKAAAKQQLAARRKAAQLAQAQLAQEQTAAQEQEAQRQADLARSQRESAERAAEEEQRRQAAAERKRAAAPVVVALDTSRRGVADSCAGSGGFFGQHSCRTRECSKPEHQGDAVCVRLRETDEVHRRASVDR